MKSCSRPLTVPSAAYIRADCLSTVSSARVITKAPAITSKKSLKRFQDLTSIPKSLIKSIHICKTQSRRKSETPEPPPIEAAAQAHVTDDISCQPPTFRVSPSTVPTISAVFLQSSI